MKKENIEHAAREHARRNFPPIESASMYRTGKTAGYISGFIEGAEWAINSVWRTDISKGQTCRIVLVHFTNGCSSLFDDIRDLTVIEDRVKAFAYLDELLPERKEETK